MLVTAGQDKTIRAWDTTTQREMWNLDEFDATPQAIALSPVAGVLAVGAGPSIHLHDVSTGRRLRTLDGEPTGVTRLAFSPDGRTLASGGREGPTGLWTVSDGTRVANLPTDGLITLAFRGDSSALATYNPAGQLELWDSPTGNRMATAAANPLAALAFSPDGRELHGAAGPADRGVLRAIVIGIDDYQRSWPRYKFCKRDAIAIAELLKRQTQLYSHVETQVLTDHEATRPGVLAALQAVAKRARPMDAFFFSFSGAGSPYHVATARAAMSAESGVFRQAPGDDFSLWMAGLPEHPASAEDGLLNLTLLAQWLNRIAAERQIVVLDTGDMSGSFSTFVAKLSDADPRVTALTGRQFLLLSPDGHSLETEAQQHGTATYSLLKALSGEADLGEPADGLITSWEVEAAVARISLLASGGKQRLRGFSQGGSFPVAALTSSAAARGAAPLGLPVLARPVKKRRDRALLFATDNYQHWKPLSNPLLDAKTIKGELEQTYQFEVELVEDPTGPAIWDALARYQKESYGEDDQLFVFFAGHGDFEEQADEGYVIAKDSSGKGALRASSIGHSVLAKMIEKIPCRHVLVALDVCFGGAFDARIAAASGRGDPVYREVDREAFVTRRLKYKSRLFVASGGKEYVPDGRPGQHSPFARKLIEALRSQGDEDGVLTFSELAQRLEKVVPEPRGGELPGNDPGGDFLFVAGRHGSNAGR
jgi:uncharacterized caspase-like protein